MAEFNYELRITNSELSIPLNTERETERERKINYEI
jgi:hypothetical protein